jgi:formylmethanofuran dehydrogenase subunit E
MDPERDFSEEIKGTVAFHGHSCPGLAIGIRAAQWALKEMGKSPDEEIVALVETDMCGVDAIQYLLSCTFGKGNLIHKDYGKNAFTFYRRRDNKAARLVLRPEAYGEWGKRLRELMGKAAKEGLSPEEEKEREALRKEIEKWILTAPFEALFTIGPAKAPVPRKARILSSLICDECGEAVMESRVRHFQNRTLCIPCFEEAEKR